MGIELCTEGEKIVLDTSEPWKLYYLEPWQMSSKYLKKIKMNFHLVSYLICTVISGCHLSWKLLRMVPWLL